MVALGDYHLHNPPAEIYAGYSFSHPFQGDEETRTRILSAVRSCFPSTNAHLNEEATRLLAMLEDDDSALPSKIAARWGPTSPATQDVHYLVVFSRLRGSHDREISRRVAGALLGLQRKLEGREQRVKQVWGERLAELLENLLRRDAVLADILLEHPDFVKPGHVVLAATFDLEHRKQAARLFLAVVKKDADFAWSGALIDLLALLPREDIRPILLAQWSNYGLRDAI